MYFWIILLVVLGVLLIGVMMYFKIDRHQIVYSFIGIFVVWGSYLLLRYADLSFGPAAIILFFAIILFTVFFEDKIIGPFTKK